MKKLNISSKKDLGKWLFKSVAKSIYYHRYGKGVNRSNKGGFYYSSKSILINIKALCNRFCRFKFGRISFTPLPGHNGNFHGVFGPWWNFSKY